VESCYFKNYEQGDCWGYVALKRNTFFQICHSVGKRTEETTNEFISILKIRLKEPTHDYKLNIFSDGNHSYENALLNHYRRDVMNYGQLIKVKEGDILVDKIRRKIFGNPSYDEIETTAIESYNSVLRNAISRLVRRTKCYSKRRRMLDLCLEFNQTYNNFVKVYGKETPAMKEGLVDKKWDWNDIFYAKLTFVN